MTTSAAPLIPAERPEPAIKANAAPGTLFTMGRSARSGRGPVPANRRATPMVLGARARCSSPIRWGQNLSDVALKDVCKPRTRSFPSSSRPPHCGLDVTSPEAAQFLLRDNLRAFFPFNAGNRILPSNARLQHRQEPSRVCRVVVSVFSRIAAVHGSNHGSGVLKCPTKAL